MSEIKQANFRIDQNTADAFRKFCEENGMNQAQGFDHIMQIVETDRAKTIMPERRTEIETFEKALKDIHAGFLYSLEINKNAEDRIREQFQSSLERSNRTIDDLREKSDRLQNEKTLAESLKTDAENAAAAARERETGAISRMEAAIKTAADQERINSMLTKQLADATAKLEGYDELRNSEASLKMKVSDLQHALDDAHTTLSHTKELYDARLSEAEKALEKSVRLEESEAALKRRISDLERNIENEKNRSENALKQAQMQSEIAIERAVMAKEREMNEAVRKADMENVRLITQIEQLQARVIQLEAEAVSKNGQEERG